jgi:hypothetical protein
MEVLVLLHLLAFVYVVVISAREAIEEGKPVVGCWVSDVLVAGRCLWRSWLQPWSHYLLGWSAEQSAQMTNGKDGECPMQSEEWLVLVFLVPQQKKLGHHGRVWFLELWERVRAIFYTVMHVNKKIVMNKNLNPFIRSFLVFEKYLLMPSLCDSLFS